MKLILSGLRYSTIVNGTTYDENNPSGLEILQNVMGCDSMVNIDLLYVPADTFNASFVVCSEEYFTINQREYFTGERDTITYPRINNCDSVLVFEIQASDRFDEFQYDSVLVVESNRAERVKHIIPEDFLFDWNPQVGLSCADCPNPVILGEDLIEQYQFTITDEMGCSITKDLDVKFVTEPYIPNIFSPNGLDQKNQVFNFFIGDHLSFTDEILVNSFKIYDRWGQLVHNISNVNLDDPKLAWDGKNRNRLAASGVYIYQIELDFYASKETSFQGTVTLIR